MNHLFMLCSSVVNRSDDVKTQGNGEGGLNKPLSLDVRHVEDEYGRCQNGGYPDESRICGLIHDDSCTYKSCTKPLAAN